MRRINRAWDKWTVTWTALQGFSVTAVRPCGIIVKAQMYTCESCTQVYAFLLLTFGRTTDDLRRLKFVGYDIACDLHPFLSNLNYSWCLWKQAFAFTNGQSDGTGKLYKTSLGKASSWGTRWLREGRDLLRRATILETVNPHRTWLQRRV